MIWSCVINRSISIIFNRSFCYSSTFIFVCWFVESHCVLFNLLELGSLLSLESNWKHVVYVCLSKIRILHVHLKVLTPGQGRAMSRWQQNTNRRKLELFPWDSSTDFCASINSLTVLYATISFRFDACRWSHETNCSSDECNQSITTINLNWLFKKKDRI